VRIGGEVRERELRVGVEKKEEVEGEGEGIERLREVGGEKG